MSLKLKFFLIYHGLVSPYLSSNFFLGLSWQERIFYLKYLDDDPLQSKIGW